MASIGSASLTIVPKFTGLSASVTSALKGVNTTSAGTSAGTTYSQAFGSGILKSGAVIGAATAVATKATDAIVNSLSSAISRFDTLNNYPKVMETLGYASKDVSASLSLMDSRLQGLPTSLDSMVSTVQGIVVTTGDLDKATKAGLALNDMLLASGSSTQLTSAAMEQFRQILAKGKPEMQDWKSLTQAMPGQMDQLAKSMLGPTANAQDLYYALGGGKESDAHTEGIQFASKTMDDLIDTMIRLDTEGGEGITSFSQQAQTASGGVETSMANIQTAITRGLANTMEAIGKENIAGMFSGLQENIKTAFNVVNSIVPSLVSGVQTLGGVLGSLAPKIAGAVTAIAGFAAIKSVTSKLSDFAFACKVSAATSLSFSKSLSEMGLGKLGALAAKINPLTIAIVGAGAAIGAIVGVFADYKQKADTAAKATTGLNDAIARASSVDSYAGSISGMGTSAKTSAKSIDELNQATAKMVDEMNSRAASTESEIAQLSTAQGIINEYTGKTDLSTEAQGKLQWAIDTCNDALGTSISLSDVAAGKYTDETGAVRDLKDSINDLIEAKKQQIKIDQLTADLTAAMEDSRSASKEYANARSEYGDKQSQYIQNAYERFLGSGMDASQAWELAQSQGTQDADAWLQQYADKARDAAAAVNDLSAAIGDASQSSQAAKGSFDEWGNNLSTNVTEALKVSAGENGLGKLKQAFQDLGVSVEEVSGLGEEDLLKLADNFDGSTASAKAALDSLGIKTKNIGWQVQDNFNGIKDALTNNEDIRGAFDDLGVNIDDFALKCANAGLDVNDFADMSAEDFKRLYNDCNQNVDATIAQIALFNEQPLVNKDGTVNINDNSLLDAQGHLYTYDGTGLYDKTAGAYVNDAEVIDATGQVWTWNGTELTSKDGYATVTGNVTDGQAEAHLQATREKEDELKNKDVSANVYGNAADGSVVGNIWNVISALNSLRSSVVDAAVNFFSGNAAGGFRMNAAGGYRYHANGAIATRAVPLDIVGEDGAEAIVPLTNRRYAMPFVDMLANGLMSKTDGSQLIDWLSANLGTIINQNAPQTIIDNDAGSLIVDNRLQQLQRKAGMNRGY